METNHQIQTDGEVPLEKPYDVCDSCGSYLVEEDIDPGVTGEYVCPVCGNGSSVESVPCEAPHGHQFEPITEDGVALFKQCLYCDRAAPIEAGDVDAYNCEYPPYDLPEESDDEKTDDEHPSLFNHDYPSLFNHD